MRYNKEKVKEGVTLFILQAYVASFQILKMSKGALF